MLDALNKVVGKYRMEINEKKPEVMHIGRGEEKAMAININGKLIMQVNQF